MSISGSPGSGPRPPHDRRGRGGAGLRASAPPDEYGQPYDRLGQLDQRGRGQDQRGISTVQGAIILPIFFFIIFAVVQGCIFYSGKNAAEGAAAACASRVRGQAANASGGRDTANSILAQSGALDHYTTAVTTQPTTVTCTVTGHAPVLVDLGLGEISQSATMAKERVT